MRCGGIFDADGRERIVAELEERSGEPNFWDEPVAARKVIAEANLHRAILNPFRRVVTLLEEAELLGELAADEKDPEQRRKTLEEAAAGLDEAEQQFERLELQSLLSERFDPNNAYVTIHAGAGGTESCDWADMLLRMYFRYAEDQGWSPAILEIQAGDEAGVKRATVQFTGGFAFGNMKAERGVHRLVRISPFDANKRRHTSFVAVDVVPELDDDVDIEINEGDLRVDTYRASGAGGQHVNTTDSAVRITHLPTGTVVACQAERSQHMNREKAMNMLRAKLYEIQQDEKRKDLEKFYGSKGEIAWGSQIRSYVLQPYTLVKDHRCGVETSNVQKVLDGDIQMFIDAWLKKQAKKDAEAK
jgi:peptide chain release factor 2